MQRLSNTGDAGTAKCFQVLRMPVASATMDMVADMTNIHRVINTAAPKPRGLAHAAGQGPHQRWRAQHTQRASQQQRPGQGQWPPQLISRCSGLLAFFGFGGCQHGHKGLRKCTLGKQAAKQVGNAESDVEGVREGAGAKHGRHQRSRTRPVTREARVSRDTVEAALNRDTAGSVFAAHRPAWAAGGLFHAPTWKHPGGCSAAQGPYAR